MRTLNIKVKELNLVKYLKDHLYDFEKDRGNKGKFYIEKYRDNEDLGRNYFVDKEMMSNKLLLENYYDLEITGDHKTKIITPTIEMVDFEGVLFNNLNFELSKEEKYNYYLFDLQNSKNVHFTNFEFTKDIIHVGRFSEVNLKYCDLKDDATLVVVLLANLNIESCKFYNSKKEKIFVDTARNFNEIATLSIRNSYVGYNNSMKYFITISGFFDDGEEKQHEFKLDDVIFEKNPMYVRLYIEEEFKG